MNKPGLSLLLVIALSGLGYIFPIRTAANSPSNEIALRQKAAEGVITSAPFLDPARTDNVRFVPDTFIPTSSVYKRGRIS